MNMNIDICYLFLWYLTFITCRDRSLTLVAPPLPTLWSEWVERPAPAAPRKRQRKYAPDVGGYQLFLVCASFGGTALWQNVFPDDDMADAYLNPECDHAHILALVRWSLTPTTEVNTNDRDYNILRQHSQRGSRQRHGLLGFLTWDIIESVSICGLPDDNPIGKDTIPLSWLQTRSGQFHENGIFSNAEKLTDVVRGWEVKHDTHVRAIHHAFFDYCFVCYLTVSCFKVLHTVPIFMRRRLFSKRLLPGGPSRSHIKRWIGKQVAATPDRQNVTHKGGNWNGLSVETVLAWLDASRYVLEQNKIHHAREAFANIDRAMQNKLV